MPKRCRFGETYLLAPGEALSGQQRYTIQRYLGQGAFAAAYQAVAESGEVCFVKEYFPPRRPSEADELARIYAAERDVLRRIGNYELIPRFRDAFHHEGYAYLVTDFIPGPDLETVLRSDRKPDWETLSRWAVCLCNELAFLHSRDVVHHDLKPSNIRLNEDGDPVLVDFSAAHWYRAPGETTDQLYGSDSFLAPEYAERSMEDAEAGKRMDVFALGRILVEMLVGQRLSQEEIDRRHDQLYGEILHSGKLDISFVRAIFRAVSYDPQRRYASGVELAEDIAPAAPPAGRVRPARLDFGTVADAAPRETNLQAYNAGGGTLRADIAVEGEWLEIGTTGAVTARAAMFERNRQTVRVVAYPERVSPGQEAVGRIVFTFPNSVQEVPVRLRRTAEAADIQVQPAALKLHVPPEGTGIGKLVFANQGSAPARVELRRPVDLEVALQPTELLLPARGRQEVLVAVEARVLGDREAQTAVKWFVEGNPRPDIPLTAVPRRAGLLGRLLKR